MARQRQQQSLWEKAQLEGRDRLAQQVIECSLAENAIDYLHQEWQNKPAGIVSYGGISAGTRAAQMLKQVITTLRVMPVPEAVSIPYVREFLDEDGRLKPNEIMESSATAMLDELLRWAEALRPLRAR